MVKVAIAGGTGGIGLHIVDAILAAKKHDVIVLSRSSNPELESRGIKVIAVSYSDLSSLEKALQGVHTVISTIADGGNPQAWADSQLALLDAAKKAGAKRFAPSEFGIRGMPNDPIEVYAFKAPVAEAARRSGLEYTIFENGLIMNYLVSGTAGVGHLQPLMFIVDIESCTANVPGDGTNPAIFTRGEDVGAFVAASLDLSQWPEVSIMAGDRTSWKEVISLAEKVRGKKFSVTYLSVEELEKRMVPNPPTLLTNSYWQCMIEFAHGERFRPETVNLNELCPEVKPMKIEEFLRTWWGKVDT